MRRLSSSSSGQGFRLLARLAFLAAAASLSAQQTPESATSLSREVKDVFGRCAKAVVKIEATDQHGELSGTGFFVDPTETPSFGMIAGFDRKCFGGYFPTKHLRVNLPPQRGEGGAPLLNLKGEVVGILLYTFENNSCYALPIEAAEKIRSDFVRFGEARHGWIGANVTEATTPVEGSRAVTKDIMKDTPAAESGMKSGDVVLQIGRTTVHEPEDILDASFFLTAGDVVPITVMRGNEKLIFNVQAGVHPASRNVPRLPGMPPGGLIAAPPLSNRAIPLNLQSVPERTP